MKKIILSFILFSLATLSFAGTNSLLRYQSYPQFQSKPIISKGVYLNLGFGFPTLGDQFRGVMPNLEFGNHFLFYKNEKFGVGMKMGWINVGVSTFTSTYYTSSWTGYYSDIQMVNLDIRFVKFGPLATFAFTEAVGLDVYIDAIPTVIVGVGTGTDYYGDEHGYGDAYFGLLVAPGAKFRYKMFAAGVDLSVGNLYGSSDLNDDDDSDITSFMFMPRIYAGFKF